MPDYYVFILFAMGAAFTLGAVIVGGYLVWKTKREPGDSLFRMREEPGEVLNAEDTLTEEFPEVEPIKTPAATAAAALKFRQQMEEEEVPAPKLAEELGKEGESES